MDVSLSHKAGVVGFVRVRLAQVWSGAAGKARLGRVRCVRFGQGRRGAARHGLVRTGCFRQGSQGQAWLCTVGLVVARQARHVEACSVLVSSGMAGGVWSGEFVSGGFGSGWAGMVSSGGHGQVWQVW